MSIRVGVTKPALRAVGEFSVQGLKEALKKAAAVLDATSAQNLKATFKEAGEVGYQSVRTAAPIAEGKRGMHQKTGIHLPDAIFLDSGLPEKPNVLLGVNHRKAPQGYWLEYGTSRGERATGWFRNAVLSARPQMAQIIITGIKDIIDQNTA